MKNRFKNLIYNINDNFNLADYSFNEISFKYNLKERRYHNLIHIRECLEEYDNFSFNLSEIEIAIWYHDVIYNPKRNDNEEKSLEFAKNHLLKLNIDKNIIDNLLRIINSTKHSFELFQFDEQIMSDIDLSIFGKDKERFLQYEQGIRFEYNFVPKEFYRKERSKILKKFIGKEKIYYTDFFRNRFEVKARENLEYLITILSN